MNSSSPGRFTRLTQTRTFRGGAIRRWTAALVVVFGAGNIGQRFATEAVLSGARVVVYDFDVISPQNLASQRGAVGARKIDVVLQQCEAIQPGRAAGEYCDARHVGIGQLAQHVHVLVDCTDDPGLAVPLTRISNGVGVPLLRPALDGSGEAELARVGCSHGAAGYSCQICMYDLLGLTRHMARTPCPGAADHLPAPTRAGGAMGMVAAGAALLQAQRLVTGNDLDCVLGRELIVDLSNGQLLSIERPRCESCLSGHTRWTLTRVKRSAAETTLADLFQEAQRRLGSESITLEPYGHPLCVEASCPCGEYRSAVGSRRAVPPVCLRCHVPMEWTRETNRDRLRLRDVDELKIGRATLDQLGLPGHGAMLIARALGKRPTRMVLK